ncbi:MAG: hypothetical protein QOK32_675 [Gaiellaceae bacterium]|jgi:hypothetical protein|nr:hypothetical protein [Gaiellaceae bacterium]
MNTEAKLHELGDALERAARRDLRPARRSRFVRAAVVLATIGAIGTGAAVAAGVFSEEQVARGMPEGSLIFGGTHPRCVLLQDGVTYACTLGSLPTQELIGDHTGAKELITIDRRIAGGCIGQDREGRHWSCYLGDEAVNREILVADLLGEYAPGPTRG